MSPFRSFARLGWFLAFVAGIALAGPTEDTERALDSLSSGDLPTAMRLLRGAAEEGHLPAMVRLAELLDVAEENDEAISLFRKAADRGDPGGMYGLGVMLLAGEGAPKDLEQGFNLIRKAAEAGNLPAMESMASTYRLGRHGVPVDPAAAKQWDERVRLARAGSAQRK